MFYYCWNVILIKLQIIMDPHLAKIAAHLVFRIIHHQSINRSISMIYFVKY